MIDYGLSSGRTQYILYLRKDMNFLCRCVIFIQKMHYRFIFNNSER